MKPHDAQSMIAWFSYHGGYSKREILAAYNKAIWRNLNESLLETFSRHDYKANSVFDTTKRILYTQARKIP